MAKKDEKQKDKGGGESPALFDSVEVYDPATSGQVPAAAQRGMIRSDTGYQQAVRVVQPRDIDKIKKALEREAEFGAKEMYYAWFVKTQKGQKRVEGPSIGLAQAAAREWGNCAVKMDVAREPDGGFTFTGIFIDIEKGFTIDRTFYQGLEKNVGKKYDAERRLEMIYSIGQSKCQRNVICAGLPRWLVNHTIAKAKEATVKGIKKDGLDKTIGKVLEYFAGLQVTEDQLILFVGKKREEWIAEDVADLKAAATMIKEAEATVAGLFGSPTTEAVEPPPTAQEIIDKKPPPAPEPATDDEPPEVPAAPAPEEKQEPTQDEPASGVVIPKDTKVITVEEAPIRILEQFLDRWTDRWLAGKGFKGKIPKTARDVAMGQAERVAHKLDAEAMLEKMAEWDVEAEIAKEATRTAKEAAAQE